MKYSRTLLRALLLFIIGVCLLPTTAFAYDVTDGIRFGAFSVHPSIYTAMKYIDNIYFLPDDYKPADQYAVPQDVESDFVYNFQPAVLFDVSIPTFTVQAGYRFYNDQYLGFDDPDEQHHKLNASNHTFTGLVDYQAPFGLLLKAQDSYTTQEAFEETTDYADFLQGEQSHNDARGLVGFAHGPEDNLYLAYTYVNVQDRYDTFIAYDKNTQYHLGEVRLKFFPRTAIVARGGYGFIDYLRIQDYDANVYWGLGGLKGQIAKNLLMTIEGGYSVNDYSANEDGKGPIVETELALLFPSNTKIAAGYRRQFRDSVSTNYYTCDQGYMTATRLWGSRLTTDFYLSYQYNEFSEPFPKHEDFIQVKFDTTLRLIFWLYTGVGYQMEMKATNQDDENFTTTRNVGLVKLLAQF